MTRVYLENASEMTDWTTSTTSAGNLTPRSGSPFNFGSESADGATSQFRGLSTPPASEGRVIRSIEETESSSNGETNYYRTSMSRHSHTLSFSLTPPPSTSTQSSRQSPSAVTTPPTPSGSDMGSEIAQLGTMRLSPDLTSNFGMSEVGAAIDKVAQGFTNTGTGLQPDCLSLTPSPSRGAPPRRRSRSPTVVAPHDVSEERPPEDRFHEPVFQQAFSDARMLMSQLRDVLGSSVLHNHPDTTMKWLREQADELAHYQCPSSRTVGFVGDSGVGKSSLLNSLLDRRNLARTSNSGAACTCVVTEYHYHGQDNFVIEVETFTKEDIRKQLTELIRSYRHWYLNGNSIDQSERKDAQESSDIARDTFRAMFRGRLLDESFLVNDSEESVIQTLRTWSRDVRQQLYTDRPEILTSLHDCAERLLHLTSEHGSDDQPTHWPYIRKIKVYLNAHILSKGLILVDLPGLRDLNSARRNITERYIVECDEIFAVCNVGRAVTDEGVQNVFNLARSAQRKHIGIICTKADDIRAEEALRDWQDERALDIKEKMDEVKVEEDKVKEIKIDLELYNDDDGDDFSEEEQMDLSRLHRELRNAEKRWAECAFDLKRYLMTTRNEEVMGRLLRTYQKRVCDCRLKVFCVSNSDYKDWREKPKINAMPYLELSGILSIREHCMSMVAENQLQDATNYIKNGIPALLSQVQLWVESGAGSMSAERKQAVRETLDVLETRLKHKLIGNHSEINSMAKSSKEKFHNEITQYSRQKMNSWIETAKNATGEWSIWYHPTYSAFCRNYGSYSTDAVGSRDWNEEAIETMVRDLEPRWRDLRSSLEESNENVTNMILELTEWGITYLDTELRNSSDAIDTLCQALSSLQRLLLAEVEGASSELANNLRILGTDALSGIQTSFVGKAMEGSYRACNRESGQGSDARRKRIINRAFGRDTLFENLIEEFKKTFNYLADAHQDSIQGAVQEHLAVLHDTFDIVRNANVALESERDPMFRDRVKMEVERAMRESTRIQTIVCP